MGEVGFSFDIRRCIGCKACQVACKEHHQLNTGSYFRRVVTRDAAPVDRCYSGGCNHCADPACTAVCPTGAMYQAPDGAVLHDDSRCIGCGRCVFACPYGAPSLSPVTGYAQKCDACTDRRAEGRRPACVEACPTRALRFGPPEQLKADFGGEAVPSPAFLPDPELTRPSLLLCQGSDPRENPEQVPCSVPGSAPAAGFRRDTEERFLILGGGIAGLSAARAIRQRNATALISVLSDEPLAPYCRPMLSKSLLTSFAMDRYTILGPDELEKEKITLYTGARVTALDPAAKQVTLADGRVLPYDTCIYALGSSSFIPPIPGADKAGVLVLRSAEDLYAIRRRLLKTRSAVLIGGGAIGLELAWELRRTGCEVTVVELAYNLMDRLLDPVCAGRLQKALEEAGITVRTGISAAALEGETSLEAVRLSDGTVLTAQLAVLAAGCRANTELLCKAGLDAPRAVPVNDYLETPLPGLYACGDCVDPAGGTWGGALLQGTLAGANAAGERLSCGLLPEPVLLHAAGTSLFSMGDMGKLSEKEYYFIYADITGPDERFLVNPPVRGRQQTFGAFCTSGGKLTGATLIGDLALLGPVQDALREGISLSALLERIKERGFAVHVQ